MPLFRQVYRVTLPSGAHRLLAVLLMAKSAVDAKDAAIDTIKAKNPDAKFELRGGPELVELPHHFIIGDEIR
jgi:hypothetical protein